MHDKETGTLQEQMQAMQGILDKHLALIEQLIEVVQEHSGVLQRHLKMHKENQDD